MHVITQTPQQGLTHHYASRQSPNPKPEPEVQSSGDEVSLGRKVAQMTFSGVGGLGGATLGLPFGAFKGAISSDFTPSPQVTSAARAVGAVAVTALGVAASVTGHLDPYGISQTAGVIISLTAGPIIGNMTGQALLSAGSGLAAGVKGGFGGMVDGARNGGALGKELVDWMAGG